DGRTRDSYMVEITTAALSSGVGKIFVFIGSWHGKIRPDPNVSPRARAISDIDENPLGFLLIARVKVFSVATNDVPEIEQELNSVPPADREKLRQILYRPKGHPDWSLVVDLGVP